MRYLQYFSHPLLRLVCQSLRSLRSLRLLRSLRSLRSMSLRSSLSSVRNKHLNRVRCGNVRRRGQSDNVAVGALGII